MTSGTRIAVAMSGGVDSSLTAALLAAEGYRVVGLTLQLSDAAAAPARKGACCAGADIRDARAVAERLSIPHYVIDRQSRFRDTVIDDFADSYLNGRTPIPCVRCNQTVKFHDLVQVAQDLGCDFLATGHYAQRVDGADGAELHRAADHDRDQSYFLFATTRAQLDYLRFPLGHLPKREVRRRAAEAALPVADKPDSQDICFVPGGRYAEVVRRLRPEADQPGEIVDLGGRVLGEHRGLIHFTVGQRRGIGLGGEAEPLYVVRLEPQTRRVVVGPRAALGVAALSLGEANWLAPAPPPEGRLATAKVRSAAPARAARWLPAGEIVFDAPEFGVAPGQACVLYDGDRVLGGGFIERTTAAQPVPA